MSSRSSGVMVRSVKSSGKDLLDSMHLGRNVAGGQSHDGSNRLRVDLFEVEKNDLAIERIE
jgi:hypothetical protein